MRNNTIIVSADPRGKWVEGRCFGVLRPGQACQIRAAAGMGDDGRFTYEPYTPGTDGFWEELVIALPDELQGRLTTDAYADGDRFFGYIPAKGDEMNVLTDAAVSFGARLTVDSGTGKAIALAGGEFMIPYKALETILAVANSLLHVRIIV